MPDLVRVRIVGQNNITAGHWVLRVLPDNRWQLSIWKKDDDWLPMHGDKLIDGPQALAVEIQNLANNVWPRANADMRELRANPHKYRRPGFRTSETGKRANEIQRQLTAFMESCEAVAATMMTDLVAAGWTAPAAPTFPWPKRGSQENPMTPEERDRLIEQNAKLDDTPDNAIGEIAIIDCNERGMMRMRQRNYRGELVTTEARTMGQCRAKHREEMEKAYPSGHAEY